MAINIQVLKINQCYYEGVGQLNTSSLNQSVGTGMAQKPVKDKKPVIRVPLLVVQGNLHVLAERLELLVAGFLYATKILNIYERLK